MILITGHVILTPEHRERMIALGAEHSARSRGEPGCLAHNCHIDVENPDRLMFVEEWASIEAVRTHFAVPASGAFVAEMRALSPEPCGDPHLHRRGCHRDADGGLDLSHAKAQRREGGCVGFLTAGLARWRG
ncbi:putative quinol monooxygenase [Sphingopyxis sp. PET50]|uniref:putative quinol monooxygenase n=1 Tax=Sphingopyxis sp. PET50 TaxID=2976533 RepID=UPI0021AE6E5A|nr:putative quinol monooxygenase [Sphingopyxis sp. PET50]